MSGDGQLQLQKAVYNALVTAHAPTKVYDHVPQDAVFPYVVIGEGEAREFDTDTEIGQEHVVTIHHFDQASGRLSVKRMQKRTYDALHDVSLSLETGAALVLCLFDFHTSPAVDPDGKTYHGVSQFRAITTES